MMNLILKMMYGPESGRRRVLQQGQRALVGGSHWCDFPAADQALGSPQFSVRCCSTGCWIENLSEATRLMVNGVTVEQKKLADGDVVSAGDSKFIAKIRGQRTAVRDLGVPLVGTEEFTAQFTRSVVSADSSVDGGFRRSTMSPSLWSESARVSNEGSGSPSQQLLEAVSCFRAAGLLMDRAVAKKLAKPEGFCSVEDLIPVKDTNSSSEAQLFLLDTGSISDLSAVIEREWARQCVMFVVPAVSRAAFRQRVCESSLWQNRNVKQASRMLVDGSFALRESLFQYTDSVVVPNADGWTLMSRPLESRAARDSA